MRFIVLVLALGICTSCIPPLSPQERLAQSAHELNYATRFARMDVALELVAEDAQRDFMMRHAPWHSEVRIVDLELTGMHMISADSAEVQLAVAWHRLTDTEMRTSRVSQRWEQGRDGWKLAEETRIAGAQGIFAGTRIARKKNARKQPQLDGVTTSSWE